MSFRNLTLISARFGSMMSSLIIDRTACATLILWKVQVSTQIADPVNGYYTGRTEEDIKPAAVPVVALLVSLQFKKKKKRSNKKKQK